MGFDYRKFENHASIGSLARAGCSGEVLKHAASRYAIVSAQPGERRKALRKAGISEKNIKAQAKAARTLSGFLGRLQQNPWFVLGNSIPPERVIPWRRDFEDAARFLESLEPFRPHAKDAALALALHVKQQTGRRHLPEIAKLLNAALSAAGLPDSLTSENLQKQLSRANGTRAQALLGGWESLPSKKRNR